MKSGFQRQQFGFGVGGALVKDKTFYYLNAEQTFDFKDNVLTSPALGINATVSGRNQFTYLSGKLDQRWTRAVPLVAAGQRGHREHRAPGRRVGWRLGLPIDAAISRTATRWNIATQNIYVGGNFTSETDVQYARFRWNYARALNPNSPNVHG